MASLTLGVEAVLDVCNREVDSTRLRASGLARGMEALLCISVHLYFTYVILFNREIVFH